MSTPDDRPDRRQPDPRIAALEAQVAELRRAAARGGDREALGILIQALDGSVHNLTGALNDVTDLQRGQQDLERRQTEIAEKVVLKDAFDKAWAANAATLTGMVRRFRRVAIASIVIVLTVVAAGVGGFVYYQVGQNHHQDVATAHQEDLNSQRVATCQQKNEAAQQTIAFFGPLIDEEKARPTPDPVFLKAMNGIVLGARLQIVDCPGATPSPTTSPRSPL